MANNEIYSLNLYFHDSQNDNEIFVIEISREKKVDSLKPIIKKRLAPLFYNTNRSLYESIKEVYNQQLRFLNIFEIFPIRIALIFSYISSHHEDNYMRIFFQLIFFGNVYDLQVPI